MLEWTILFILSFIASVGESHSRNIDIIRREVMELQLNIGSEIGDLVLESKMRKMENNLHHEIGRQNEYFSFKQ